MKNRLSFVFIYAFLAGVVSLISNLLLAADRGAETPLLRGLFLGDHGHHLPAERFRQLAPVLAGRRIELDYSDSLDDLNPAKLAGYDFLLIYANWTKISSGQEKALLDFVAAGGGLVAVHCASYCFLNSPKYRSEEHTSELQSHGYISYAAFCLKKIK